MSSFTTPLDVRVHNVPLKDRPFEILDYFEFYSDKYDGFKVGVEQGYRTDFGSVPRFFWRVISPIGRYNKATVIHDWLLDNRDKHNLTTHQINVVFREAMIVSGVKAWRRETIYVAVEAFLWIKDRFKK